MTFGLFYCCLLSSLVAFDYSDYFPELHPMNQFIHFNGEILPAAKEIVTAGNRGLRYGDGLFETIKVIHGEIPLISLHLERLARGLSVLQIQLPACYTSDYITESIIHLCRINNTVQAARIRLTICRGNGTLYTVEDPQTLVIIQADPLPEVYGAFNETGWLIDIYPPIQKSCDILANLKSNNYLPYVMAALYSQQHQLNDCLVLNTHSRVCDATIANIFWVHNHVIFTPPLSEGGVAGVMRQYLLNRLQQSGYAVQEKPCTADDLEQADEVFLTNALYGIRWVQQFRTKLYANQLSANLYEQFIKNLEDHKLS